MIETVVSYIIGRLETVKHRRDDGSFEPIDVYGPPGPPREEGETEYPCVVVRPMKWEPDPQFSGAPQQILEPSEETVTITVPEQHGTWLKASVVGSTQEPFQIERNVSDSLLLRVETSRGWSSPQAVTIISGSRSAEEVCDCTGAWILGIRPSVVNGRVKLETSRPGMDLEILEVPNSAYDVLGLSVGVVSHLVQTGPAQYQVKQHPQAVILPLEIEIRATNDTQRRALEQFVLDLFPDGHWPQISVDCAPVFNVVQGDFNDEPEDPEFVTIVRYRISQLWVPRLTDFTVQGVRELGIDMSVKQSPQG